MNDLFNTVTTMKALSLWQPWASLVAAGVKVHETRHWHTDYRGLIAISASKTMDYAGSPDGLCADALGGRFWSHHLPLGAVVAIGRLSACRRAQDVSGQITKADREAGNFTHGRYAWRFEDVRRIAKPIPVVGRQGLFNWTPPPDIDQLISQPIDHAATCQRIGWA